MECAALSKTCQRKTAVPMHTQSYRLYVLRTSHHGSRLELEGQREKAKDMTAKDIEKTNRAILFAVHMREHASHSQGQKDMFRAACEDADALIAKY